MRVKAENQVLPVSRWMDVRQERLAQEDNLSRVTMAKQIALIHLTPIISDHLQALTQVTHAILTLSSQISKVAWLTAWPSTCHISCRICNANRIVPSTLLPGSEGCS